MCMHTHEGDYVRVNTFTLLEDLCVKQYSFYDDLRLPNHVFWVNYHRHIMEIRKDYSNFTLSGFWCHSCR